MIDGHGNNIELYGEGAVEVDFSSNIAFNNHSQKILEHLRDHLSMVVNYPDPEARRLSKMVAELHNIESCELLITNGSAEAFYLLAHLFARQGKTKTVITTPSFSEYEDSCRLYDHQLSFVPLKDLLSTDLTEFDTLWLGSPNNPDGYRITLNQVEVLAARYPRCTFVVDRAYNDLSGDAESNIIKTTENIIVINSFTKAYGIPGLRLGYLIGADEIIEKLSTMRPPWSVNSLSLVAGEYIVENMSTLQPNVEELIAESKSLQQAINQINGYRVVDSNCNFFMVEIVDGRAAAELQEYLISEHKILIRDGSNFRGLTDSYFRVAVQAPEQNQRLIKALKQWI